MLDHPGAIQVPTGPQNGPKQHPHDLEWFLGKVVIYSQDLGYSIPGLRILNPDNLVLGFIFKDPES